MDRALDNPDWPILVGVLEREDHVLKAAELRDEVARINMEAMIAAGISPIDALAWCDLPSRERMSNILGRRGAR